MEIVDVWPQSLPLSFLVTEIDQDGIGEMVDYLWIKHGVGES